MEHSLQHQEYPQANPGIRGEAALAGKQPMSNKVAKYVKAWFTYHCGSMNNIEI